MFFDRLLKIFIICLLAATVYLLFTLIQAVDMARLSMTGRADAVPAVHPDAPVTSSGTEFANSAYFPAGAPQNGSLGSVIFSDPPGLNPLLANEASAQSIFSLCSLTLAERDWAHPEKFLPALAESWQISPDKKIFRVKLKKGVMWQPFTDPESGKLIPPQEVVADDVKFTVDTILDPDVNCAALRSYYADLEKVTVLSPYELEFRWKKRYYGSLSATLELFPLPRHFYLPGNRKFDGRKFNDDHKRNRMIVGCGPYKFVSWDKSRRIVLERNELYIGRNYHAAPPLQKRVFEIIKLPNTQFQSLLAGKTGMLSLSPEQWHLRTGIREFTSGRLKKLRYPGTSYTYIGYNQRKECFADAATRRALTMLINRQEILQKILFDCGKVAVGPFAPGSAYSDPELQPHPYDPEKARRLLADAGWRDSNSDGILERNGKNFTFTMLQISGSSLQMKILPMIKNYFAAAGIDMKLQVVEWSVLIERLKNQDFEACNLGWTGSTDPDPYQIFHSSQSGRGGDNFIAFKNPQLDRKIIELRGEFDLARRIKLCREIEKIIHDEQPYTFMFYTDSLLALDARYRNVRIFPHGVRPLSFFFDGAGIQ